MGRGTKQLFVESNVDRRFSGYYSTPKFVADFIGKELLRINPDGKNVLDPCAGKEELHEYLRERDKSIDGIDLVDFEIEYQSNFVQKDFIEFYEEKKSERALDDKINLDYDYFILNPPYNCHEVDYIRSDKARLKKLFPEVGVHNMYSMFISAVIDCAKEGAVLGFITLDSFLTARLHYKLRKQIYDQCSIHTLVLCPTDLFRDQKADVRTCIMILQKGKSYQKEIYTKNRVLNIGSFKDVLEKGVLEKHELSELVLNHKDDLDEFVIGCPSEIWTLFKYSRLGDVFRCVTGISTADDKKYIATVKKKGYSIPFFKNPGAKRFYVEPNGYITDEFLEIDKKIANFQVRNKDVLFREGITCSSMGVPFTACYLPVDSTFGVNANIICSKNDIWWLIGYLNSSLVTYLVRGVLLRSNMITSGYVSRIPIAPLTEKTKKSMAKISKNEFENQGVDADEAIKKIDGLIYKDLGITVDTQKQIFEFCNNLLRYA